MDGSATPTMEMSRPSRKSAPHRTTRRSQVREDQPSAEWMEAEVVGAGAIGAGVRVEVMSSILMHVHPMHKHYL